ncbi:hypothetical protein STSP1_01600 [Sedimentisphaera salicampi]|uniref:Uncharacterized protein n=1 Tax=Sedimentisphaera salicampi TaxID=1941349 RepID=A0A1W6LN82_9BACT|nr:hypothetical protein STSP1_01600 [Sedimentisphaera salicampi]
MFKAMRRQKAKVPLNESASSAMSNPADDFATSYASING